jgi:hypothetical protein
MVVTAIVLMVLGILGLIIAGLLFIEENTFSSLSVLLVCIIMILTGTVIIDLNPDVKPIITEEIS